MYKRRVFSTIVLFLGIASLFLFGQLSTFEDNEPNANAERGEMSAMANVTKIFMPYTLRQYSTVMFFCNPTLNNAKVTIQTYGANGDTQGPSTFIVPKKTLLKVCNDVVVIYGQGWQNDIGLPLGSSVAWAKITYPSSLKVTAYTVLQTDGSLDTYDPSKNLPLVPLALL
jgi:hypothetical protein